MKGRHPTGGALPGGPGECKVAGRVLDAAGRPVAGATVIWVDARFAKRSAVPDHEAHYVGHTAKNGEFRVEDLPSGRCLLAAEYWWNVQGMNGFPLADAVEVELDSKTRLSDIELRLPFEAIPMCEVEVALVDEDGRPVADAHWGLNSQLARPEQFSGSVAGADGIVRTQAPAGDRLLRIDGTSRTMPREVALRLIPGETARSTVVLPARPEKPITGGAWSMLVRVSDERGAPIASAKVTLFGGAETLAWGTTDARGETLFEGLPVKGGTPTPAEFLAGVWKPPYEDGDSSLWIDEGQRRLTAVLGMVRAVEVRLRPYDVETGRPIEEWTFRYRLARRREGRSKVPPPQGSTRLVSSGGGGRSGGSSSSAFGLSVTPGPVKGEVSVPGYETEPFDVTVPRQDAPFEVDIPMTPRRGGA